MKTEKKLDTVDEQITKEILANTAPGEKPLVIDRVKRWYRMLPDKKRYLEFMTALLSIPVLLTVIILNISSLQSQKNAGGATGPSAITTPNVIIVTQGATSGTTVTPSPTLTPTSSPTPDATCKNQIGPVSIAYPNEGDVISDDPICLSIVRSDPTYCSVFWSYRINGGAWSDYTDKSICMYGLSSGQKNLELRVKNFVSGDETILKRTFSVAGSTATPVPGTQSATLQ